VRAIDASGTVGYPSVEKQAKPHESSSGADPHLVLSSGEGTSCAGCHSVHHAPAAGTRIGWNLMWTVSGPNEDMMCLRCHSVNSGLASTDTSSVIGDPLNLSAMPVWTSADATTTGSITCSSCHAAIAKEGSPTVGLVSAGGTGMIHVGGVGGDASCYACHGSGTSLPFGDMTVFENSAHVAVPDPPSGSKVKCVACHDIPASRNLRLQKYADFMLCVQCHDAPSGGEPSIWEKLQLNEDANAKHPLLPQDQSTGARMSCENCHNSMALTLSNPLVNPRDPGPSGIWAGDGTQRSFCFQCHNGATLPTSVEATPWAGPILARGGETTTCDIQTAYETNIHGAGASIDTSADAFLRADMGYVTDTVLDCSACHDPHGTSNNYALKDSVTSADGQMTESGLSVYRIPAGGYDTRFFCASCHIITPEAHTLAAPASGVDLNQFPIDCTSCHRHIKGVYQDDLL